MNPLALIRRAVWLLMGPIVVAAISACNSTNVTTLYQTQCDGKTLVLQKVVKKTFENAYTSAQIVYAGKAPIVLDIGAMSNSLPYEKSVYGKAPFHLFDVKPHSYQYVGTTLRKLQTMVYVDPKIYSQEEFETLSGCLQMHSDDFSKAIDGEENLQQFQIVGAVYGNHEDFVERFTKNAKDWYEVAPDGDTWRTQLDSMGIKGMKSESIGGISNVKAGRVIEITDAKEASLKTLQAYKNADGKALTERFNIVPEPKQKSKNEKQD